MKMRKLDRLTQRAIEGLRERRITPSQIRATAEKWRGEAPNLGRYLDILARHGERIMVEMETEKAIREGQAAEWDGSHTTFH